MDGIGVNIADHQVGKRKHYVYSLSDTIYIMDSDEKARHIAYLLCDAYS